ncbi:Pyrimidine 5'-nucleotidase YjjG [Gimesia chilikensis]|uniref:Pyrimidine 5'-nucleotidase YjjG n=1 Tax=Gimesia chilikensis TaxID=2605989 RepID=A0A517W6I8_9PLAN|nr:HAD family hydrolase [Gimesia chilikensis]QDU00882.1 Pyrimidine 5'-nucleotidase YjjG [Gimesia chilikensis]
MLPNADIKAILFDLDNTLLDRSTAVRRYFTQLLQDASPPLPEDEFEFTLLTILARDRLGYEDRAAFFDWAATTCFPDWTPAELWSDFREKLPRMIEPDPLCLRLLQRLQPHYALAVITNGSAELQRAKIEAAGIDQLIDHIWISEETGAAKPDRAIFAQALAALGVTPQQALFVGDHPHQDISGARQIGMHTCWMQLDRTFPGEFPEPHCQISSLDSLQCLVP